MVKKIKNVFSFTKEHVVWPSNKETWKKTGIVFAVVAVMAVFLITADSLFAAILSAIV